ncbi:MAG TPA: PIN domain-containing protein [Myxococcales bacterium]|nr:PIN domain-containing protein [Myxococcales bacterium]
MTRTLLDTSFFIAVERRDLQAMEKLFELLEGDDDSTAISAVTLVELLASPTLSAERRAFYEKLRLRFDVLPVTALAAMAGIAAARRVGGAKAPDVMIAGVAIEHGLRVLTADAGFARLLGTSAELVRVS